MQSLRNELNAAYDEFVRKFGPINDTANRRAFRGDPDLPLLLSLEKLTGETVEKADIFNRATVGAKQYVQRCESIADALLVSLSRHGRVELDVVAKLTGKPLAEAAKEAEQDGLLFLDPESLQWETADAYLSGHIRDKIAAAEAGGERFRGNIEALKGVIPKDLEPGEIAARLGSNWIPASDYEAFLNDTLKVQNADIAVRFNAAAGAWSVDGARHIERSVAATQVWGTSRIDAMKLVEMAMNGQIPTVRDRLPNSERYVVNAKETLAAREKTHELKEAFAKWVWEDHERSNRLVRTYNDQFNSIRERRYDGSHLELPGFSNCYELDPHQKNAIWRIVSGHRNCLLAHCVGAGKTLTMICAGMEMRRLGLVSKPTYVVPNHMLEQFAAEFMRAYPGANILMASKDDLEGDQRRTLLSRIATGDWDAVLITHASFERIKMSDEALTRFIQERIAELETAILIEKVGRGNAVVKELERAKKSWNVRLERLSAKAKKDDLLTFEQLGIDALFVDEAHYYKNLFRMTKMTRVAGLPNSNSERAFDMFLKTRYVMEINNADRGVVFATATPIANSMAEMWVMQSYLQPRELASMGIGMFDAWAANFGETVTSLEIAPDGSGYRMNTRFARFVNLPELMAVFRQVADVQTAQMLNLPVPTVKYQTVAAPPSDALKQYVQSLVSRAEKIKNGGVSPEVDNMLAVTNDGRKAALDMRMVAGVEDFAESKLNKAVERMHDIWAATHENRGTQLVFCDLSTPRADAFSAYHDIKGKLMARGVPEEQIAFIHDCKTDTQKESLFQKVRDGLVRFLLGSTLKMGVGTNAQTRIVAIHEIDAPWRPADVEQRVGRGVRQGNMNDEIEVARYVTEGSFDAYMWQTLETKMKFIAQVMSGDTSVRSVEDVQMAALSFAEVKALASGNPLVLEKAAVDSEVAKLSVLKAQWERQQWRNRSDVQHLPVSIGKARELAKRIEQDLQAVRVPQPFSIRIMDRDFADLADAHQMLAKIVEKAKGSFTLNYGDSARIGHYAGMDVFVVRRNGGAGIFVRGQAEYNVSMSNRTNWANAIVLTIKAMDKELDFACQQLQRLERQLEDMKQELSKPFDKDDQLKAALARQRQIESELDLDKDNAGASSDDDAAVATPEPLAA